MINISVADSIKSILPELKLSCIECDVIISSDTDDLWGKIDHKIKKIESEIQLDQISKLPAIAASRRAYKACGKDPARYRLSAEALLRRVIQGKGLYRVNNIIDLLNFVSISSGYSIGGYDADKINGNIEFGIGNRNEPYNGIGRGDLNIENLPVFRDATSAFGSPTSDSERTAVTRTTSRFLMIIINFGNPDLLHPATEQAVRLLEEYGKSHCVNVWEVC